MAYLQPRKMHVFGYCSGAKNAEGETASIAGLRHQAKLFLVNARYGLSRRLFLMTVASGELQRCVMTGEGRFTAGVFFAVSVVRTAKDLGFPEDGRTVIPEVLIDTKEHRGDYDIAGNVILFQGAVLIVLKPPFP